MREECGGVDVMAMLIVGFENRMKGFIALSGDFVEMFERYHIRFCASLTFATGFPDTWIGASVIAPEGHYEFSRPRISAGDSLQSPFDSHHIMTSFLAGTAQKALPSHSLSPLQRKSLLSGLTAGAARVRVAAPSAKCLASLVFVWWICLRYPLAGPPAGDRLG